MKFFVKALAVLMIISLIAIPVVKGEDSTTGVWTITPSNSFVFIGANVSFSISGVPSEYCFLGFFNSSGGEVFDTLVTLDQNGGGSYVFEAPVEMTQGNYTVVVSYNGEEVTRCGLEVILNEYLYLSIQLANLNHDMEVYKNQTLQNIKQTQDVQNTITTYLVITVLSLLVAIVSIVVVLLKFKPWIEWKAVNNERKNRKNSILKIILHPYAQDRVDVFIKYVERNLAAEKAKRRAARKGKAPINPTVVIPSSDSPIGVDVFELVPEEFNEKTPEPVVEEPKPVEKKKSLVKAKPAVKPKVVTKPIVVKQKPKKKVNPINLDDLDISELEKDVDVL